MITYIYNKTEFPDINVVWKDKQTYPYALIWEARADTVTGVQGAIYLFLSTAQLQFVMNTFNNIYSIRVTDGGSVIAYEFKDSAWLRKESRDKTVEGTGVIAQTVGTPSVLKWASYDVYTSNGELFLATSEPYSPKMFIQKATIQGIADSFREITGKADLIPITKEAFATEIEAVYQKGVEVGTENAPSDGLSINGIIKQYKVNTGETVNAGDFVEFVTKFGKDEFTTGNVNYIKAVNLGEGRVLVAYSDLNNNSRGTVTMLYVSGSSVTVGNSVVFADCTTSEILMERLNADSVVILYKNDDEQKGYVSVIAFDDINCTIIGNDIVIDVTPRYLSMCVLSENKVVISYFNSYVYLTAVKINVAENVASFERGANLNRNYDSVYYTSLCAINENTFVQYVTYYSSYSNQAQIAVYKVNDLTITYLNRLSLSGSIYSVAFAKISDNKYVCSYQYSNYIYVSLFEISGSTPIEEFKWFEYEDPIPTSTTIVALSENKFLLAYGTSQNKMKIRTITRNGSTLTVNSSIILGNNGANNTFLVPFSTNSALLIYRDGVGKYQGISIEGDEVILQDNTNDTSGIFIQSGLSRQHNVGVARTGGTEGQICDVYIAKIRET